MAPTQHWIQGQSLNKREEEAVSLGAQVENTSGDRMRP